ncbi:MAG: Smr/MutS family protein [Caldimonas sp.]
MVKTKAHGLHELAAVRQALQDARRESEARAAREREQLAAARRERELFANAVGAVVPLRKAAVPVVERPRPPAAARQRERDEAAVVRESISDEFDVETLLETDEALSFRRRDIGPDVVRKLRRGVWALQGQLDLHGLRRDEARVRLADFLRDASRSGLRCVRVIHGKGNGSPGREPVLKGKVRNWLVQKEEVLAFTQARAADGGHGALIVLLRPAKGAPAASERAR